MSNANLPPSGGSVLVTGASGFLGRHLLAALSERGRVGHGLVRDVAAFVGQDWVDELGGVSTVEGGLSDRSAWISSPALSDCQSIIHSAALVDHSRSEADKVYRTNVDGTLEMVRAAHDLGARLVFVSTSGTVGCFDDRTLEPTSWLLTSKTSSKTGRTTTQRSSPNVKRLPWQMTWASS